MKILSIILIALIPIEYLIIDTLFVPFEFKITFLGTLFFAVLAGVGIGVITSSKKGLF